MNDAILRFPGRLSLALAFTALFAAASTAAVAQDATTGKTDQADAAQLSWSDLDTDSNGSLSATEAEASPGLKAHFEQADANADGALTGDEYRTFLAKRENGTDGTPGKTPKS